LVSIFTGITLLGAAAATVHGQGVPTGGASRVDGMGGVRPGGGGSPGVGPFAIFVTDRNQKISLGRATSFTLQGQSSGVDAATGAMAGRRSPGTALIDFAANDEQVSAQSCVMTPGCSLQEVVIQELGARDQVTHEWVLRPVVVSELHMGSATSVAFTYQSLEHMNPSGAGQNPGVAGSNLNQTKTP